MTGARLGGADLRGARFVESQLFGADFSDADLRGATLVGANLASATFAGADLRGADMRESGAPPPGRWLDFLAARAPYERPEDAAHFAEGLRKAGLE